MKEVIKVGTEEIGRELIKKANVYISLEGWPCAVAVIGIGIAYAISVKFKCDSQKYMVETHNVVDMEKISKVA